jgi:hypothetical protein
MKTTQTVKELIAILKTLPSHWRVGRTGSTGSIHAYDPRGGRWCYVTPGINRPPLQYKKKR